jgi:cell wall-associated NlpC family hydrolase
MGTYRFRTTVAAGLACALFPWAPATADIDQQIQDVQTQLSQLQQQAAAAAEQVNEATLKWQEAQQAVATKQAELASTQQSLATQQANLNQVVSQIYRNGGIDPTLLMLASDRPSSLLATLDTARIIASTQNGVLERTQATEQQMQRDEIALQKAEKKADKARNDIIDAKAAIDEKVAESTALLSELQAEQQRQLAEELARQQEQQQQQAETAVEQVTQLPESTTKPVVEYAIKQVGKKFEQGADGPDAFDSSGLVKAAWAQSDVTLPHSVQRQFDKTERIDITALQPGDIVFLYGTGEHAGLYTGDGYFVHAKSPREGVVYENLFTNEYMSQFAGAGRPRI